MLYVMVAIHDRALGAYQTPFAVRAQGEAIRAFQDAINNPESPMHKHPDDYDLYSLGTYDDSNGLFTAYTPTQLAIGKQMKIGG